MENEARIKQSALLKKGPPEVVKAPDQNMVDKKSKPKRNSGETAIPKDPTNPCEYEKKAADEGIVLNPQIVKHMGNIDDLAQVNSGKLLAVDVCVDSLAILQQTYAIPPNMFFIFESLVSISEALKPSLALTQ
ncbi:unnamed protein product [Nippostrongylus brasiliensis]|uniref:Actin-related protein 2/3 complex subunit 5 n=1 Tax=Nippostrongylus brasiliensis TaxID=27835 RepID=A0A0N4YGF3_NIPBR|nr:unnamed protein product [Nippostrongylus brasiliensis]